MAPPTHRTRKLGRIASLLPYAFGIAFGTAAASAQDWQPQNRVAERLPTAAGWTAVATDEPEPSGAEKPPQAEKSPEAARADEPEDREEYGFASRFGEGPLGQFLHAVSPAGIQRPLDRRFGFDADDVSDKPEAPEIPEPVFLEFQRPLGALKYESEVNTLGVVTGGNSPDTLYTEYVYVFRDWTSAKVELEFNFGSLDTIEPGFQQTLGVGPDGNWVHGVQAFPEIYVRDQFVGGTAVYMFNWKPTKRSPISTSFWAGVNRAVNQDDENFRGRSRRPGLGFDAIDAPPGVRERDVNKEDVQGVWRPLLVADAWYELRPGLAVGIENDFYLSRDFPQAIVLPHVFWEPSERFFLQAGVGYYRFGSEGQAVAMLHLNVVDPSPRKSRETRRRR